MPTEPVWVGRKSLGTYESLRAQTQLPAVYHVNENGQALNIIMYQYRGCRMVFCDTNLAELLRFECDHDHEAGVPVFPKDTATMALRKYFSVGPGKDIKRTARKLLGVAPKAMRRGGLVAYDSMVTRKYSIPLEYLIGFIRWLQDDDAYTTNKALPYRRTRLDRTTAARIIAILQAASKVPIPAGGRYQSKRHQAKPISSTERTAPSAGKKGKQYMPHLGAQLTPTPKTNSTPTPERPAAALSLLEQARQRLDASRRQQTEFNELQSELKQARQQLAECLEQLQETRLHTAEVTKSYEDLRSDLLKCYLLPSVEDRLLTFIVVVEQQIEAASKQH